MSRRPDLTRPLLAYAFASERLKNSKDYLEAITILFYPALISFTEQGFTSQQFFSSCNSIIGSGLTEDSAIEVLSALEKTGIVKNTGSAYYIIPTTKFNALSEEKIYFENRLNSLIDELVKFASNFPSLIAISMSRDDLEEMLTKFLVKIEFENRKIGEFRPERSSTLHLKGDKFDPLAQPVIFRAHFKREEDYICARFISHLSEVLPEKFDYLSELQSASLLVEVLQEVLSPSMNSTKADKLSIYLDAPFLMEYLGLNGKLKEENAKFILRKLRDLSVKICVFEHSLREIEEILRTVLSLPPYLRTGLMGDSLRRREITAEYAQSILKNIGHHMKVNDIEIQIFSFDLFPNSIQYFPADIVDDLYSALAGWQKAEARERDAQSITAVMRRRFGHRSSEVFDTRHLMLSHNEALCQIAFALCRRRRLISNKDVGPAIFQRKLAALLWLRLGNEDRLTVSRGQLLSNAAFVMRSTPEAVHGMRESLMRISSESESRLEIMLSEPRTMQLALDLTMGGAIVVDDSNVQEIFRRLEDSLTAPVREKAESEIGKLQAELQAQQAEAKKLARKIGESTYLEERVQLLERESLSNKEKERHFVESVVDSMYRKKRNKIVSVRIIFAVVLAILSVACFYSERNFVGILFVVLATLAGTPWPYEYAERRTVEKWERKQSISFRNALVGLARADLLERFDINWRTGAVTERENLSPETKKSKDLLF